MRRILTASLRGHSRRFVAGGIAVVLSVAYVTAVLVAIDSVKGALEKALGAQYANADLVVTQSGGQPIDREGIGAVDGVAATARSGPTPLRATYPDGANDYTMVAAVPTDPALRWHDVVSGRLPDAPGEIAISRATAEDSKLAIGDQIQLAPFEGEPETLRVMGVASTTSMVENADLFAPERTVASMAGGEFGMEVLVRLADGTDPGALSAAVSDAAGNGTITRTGPEQVQAALAQLTGGIDVIGGLLLGFAAIATFVALLVVANTFTIMIAQRARELALFRCVGAAKGQVFRAVLVESSVLGLAFSVVGLAAGIGLAQLALRLLEPYLDMNLPEIDLALAPVALLLPLGVGVSTTVLAALAPARRATKVPPLAALHPEFAIRVRSRAGAFRLIAGGILILVGGGMLAVGMRGATDPFVVLVGVCGGALSFLGVLLFGPILAPAVVRLLGLVARRAGVPGNVAVGNAVRNPRRTAATASALLVGVTLISILVVGAASSEATFAKTLDEQYPMDLTISVPEVGDPEEQPSAFPRETVDEVERLDGIETVLPLHAANGRIGGERSPWQITGVDPRAAAGVLHGIRPIDGLRDGVAVLSPSTARGLDVKQGDQLRIAVDGRTQDMRVRVIKEIYTPNVMVTETDLRKLVAEPRLVGLWAKVAPDVDAQRLSDDLESTIGSVPNVALGGSVQERAFYGTVADVMLMTSTGLLAMAVAIALVGVGNTLSLSVLERTRENALLRALGLTRRQLRGTLAIEALLLSGTAVLIGVVLGAAYGYVGTSTLLGGIESAGVRFELPWGRLAWIVLIAVGTGLLASVLPARRAAKVHPAAALGDE